MISYAPYARFSWDRIPQWWGTRHLRFATQLEAWDYLDDLRAKHKNDVVETKVETFFDPPNYAWRKGEMVQLKKGLKSKS